MYNCFFCTSIIKLSTLSLTTFIAYSFIISKANLNEFQTKVFVTFFSIEHNPSHEHVKKIAEVLDLTSSTIEGWLIQGSWKETSELARTTSTLFIHQQGID